MSAWTSFKLSRRAFLKKAGVAAAALAAASPVAGQPQPAAAKEDSASETWAILIDLTRCTGCNACALACKTSNQLPHPDSMPDALTSNAYTFIDERQIMVANGEFRTEYVKRQCMHCLDPACASACTVGALRKTAEGPVVYEASKCIGCRYCQYACPFGVPAYEWDNALGLIYKCQMCAGRLAEGQQPACIGACPNGALRFGKRAELLALAHGLIAANPNRYVDHIYGESEAGGTSMLYLSSVPFSQLGFPSLGSQPIPHYAEAVMRQTPTIALTVASVVTALYWLTRRREYKLHTDARPTGEESHDN